MDPSEQAVPPTDAAAAPGGPSTSFVVTLIGSRMTGLVGAGNLNYGASGRARLVIHRGTLTLEGTRWRLFGAATPVHRQTRLDGVINVEHLGNLLRFEIASAARNNQRVRVQTVDDEAARALARRLPATRNADFSAVLTEHSAFVDALHDTTPHAWVTPVLIAANLVMFAIATAMGGGLFKINPDVMIRLGTDYTPLTYGGQWWRLLTCIFLHFGLLHIALNMWALLVNGAAVERIFGSSRYLLIYLFAGLAGSATSLLWHPVVDGAGASGAIFGILGALIAFFLKREGGVPPSVLKSQRRAAAVFVIYSLINGASSHRIDNAAHLGGLLAGFAMGWILSRPLGAVRRSRFWYRQWLTAATLVGVVTLSFVGAVAHQRSPITRMFAGISLGTRSSDLLKQRGAPDYRAPRFWIYHAGDAAHPGLLTVTLSADAAPSRVIGVEYTGDRASAPAELPDLEGESLAALSTRFAAPIRSRQNFDATVTSWFRNGICVELRDAAVFEYGICDAQTNPAASAR